MHSRLEFTADMISLLESEITINLDGESISYREPEAAYEYMQLAKNLNCSYEKLPKEIRDVFNSAIEIGNSYQKTSELYNIPIGTVRSRISRAREIMKNSCLK